MKWRSEEGGECDLRPGAGTLAWGAGMGKVGGGEDDPRTTAKWNEGLCARAETFGNAPWSGGQSLDGVGGWRQVSCRRAGGRSSLREREDN